MSLNSATHANMFAAMRPLLPLEKMEQNADAWAKEYKNNQPCPYIALDEFFDKTVIRELIADYPGPIHPSWKSASYDQQFEHAKRSLDRIEDLPFSIRNFIEALNSPLFLRFLERLTGIDGLIPDPYLVGGGLHMTGQGGKLGIHADFNLHKKLRLDRRLNLLLYLNANWRPEWRGEFELWDKDVKHKVKSYLPIANRLVVFSTTDTSMHGQPDPLQCPKGEYRRSIALYYYSNGRPDEEKSAAHTTLFKARPSEQPSAVREIVRQITPPIVWEMAKRFR